MFRFSNSNEMVWFAHVSIQRKNQKNMQFITELTICVYRMKFETFTVNAWDDLESITNQLQFVITCKKRIILGIQQLDFSLNTKTGSLQQEWRLCSGMILLSLLWPFSSKAPDVVYWPSKQWSTKLPVAADDSESHDGMHTGDVW